MLPTPKFHHLHLNSVDPDAAIDFYTRQFPSTSKGSWGGFPALKSPNNVMVLFDQGRHRRRPASRKARSGISAGMSPTARRSLETYKTRPEVELLPLYTSEEGGSVLISSDTWPGQGGVLGLTKAQIAEARQKGLGPAGGGGFSYMRGTRRRARRVCRRPPGRALQPRAPLPGGPALRAALVPEASERAAAGRLGRRCR